MKKYFLVTVLFLSISLTVFGQKNNDFPSFEKFYSSLAVSLKYPIELQDSCIPTITLMKIIFDNTGKIESLSFSDSAHPKFVEYMQKIKSELDFNSIYNDLHLKNNNAILIPLQIDFEKMDKCKSTISSANLKKLYLFEGKPLSGEYFLYPYVYANYVVGRVQEEHF